MYVVSRTVTIDNSSVGVSYQILTKNNAKRVFSSSTSSDLVVSNSFAINNTPEVVWHQDSSEDVVGYSVFLYVNIIVIGV